MLILHNFLSLLSWIIQCCIHYCVRPSVFSLPRHEHMKRSPNCAFLTMKKDFTELTVAEFYLMEKERLKVFYVSVSAS